MSHTIRLFVVKDQQGKHHVFDKAGADALKANFTQEEYEFFIGQGQWREIQLHEPVGRHDEEISRLCIVRDEKEGFRVDALKQPEARAKVMIESWINFPAPFSVEAWRELPLVLKRVIDAEICEFMCPTAMDTTSFFQPLKNASSS